MQAALSRIWTQVVMSISNKNNHYTTVASTDYYSSICIFMIIKSHILEYKHFYLSCPKYYNFNLTNFVSTAYVDSWFITIKLFTFHENHYNNSFPYVDHRLITMKSFIFQANLNYKIFPMMFEFQSYKIITRSYVYTILRSLLLATLFEGDTKALFSIATTPRCRGGYYSIPWIALLYPWSLP